MGDHEQISERSRLIAQLRSLADALEARVDNIWQGFGPVGSEANDLRAQAGKLLTDAISADYLGDVGMKLAGDLRSRGEGSRNYVQFVSLAFELYYQQLREEVPPELSDEVVAERSCSSLGTYREAIIEEKAAWVCRMTADLLEQSSDRPPDFEEAAILLALSKIKLLQTAYDLSTRVEISEKTINQRLKGLLARKLVLRPNGVRGGYCITPKGLAAITEL